jgi:hypothetical protein
LKKKYPNGTQYGQRNALMALVTLLFSGLLRKFKHDQVFPIQSLGFILGTIKDTKQFL